MTISLAIYSQSQDSVGFCNDVIQQWETHNKSSCTDKQHKSDVLKELVRACGLSSNLSVPKLRALLVSLKKQHLPICPKQIDLMLTERGESIAGPGRRSTQQRKMLLLELMDPSLKNKMGTNTIKTGDYKWRDELADDLLQAVSAYLEKWVSKSEEPPFNYYHEPKYLWLRRRQAGLEWVQSPQGRAFAKEVYQAYATAFESATEGTARSAFGHALEEFYVKKREKEEGELRHLVSTILQPLYSSCVCTFDNVFDKFSFIILNLYRAVYAFFGTKVRKSPDVEMPKRMKDREDDAKTYYICGCVLRTLRTQVKDKPQTKELLVALNSLTVEAKVAAKLGLPTRHVTLKNRGGLLFASKGYYELMCKIEMRFYSTILMRKNFALLQSDAIANIKNQLLVDDALHEEFQKLIPNGEECADILWELLVTRISNLHGNETASQLTSELAALKRKTDGAKRLRPDKRTVSAKYEQLRAARKRKKIERVIVVCFPSLNACLS